MAWKMYDYACSQCGVVREELLDDTDPADDTVDDCEHCHSPMERQHPAPVTFTTIVPTYTGSAKHKAGYVHKHGNRPAEKTQVGYGGSVSKDHPTGSMKNND